MILPSKHLSEDRALVTIGAEVLGLLREPKTVSRLWTDLKKKRAARARQRGEYDARQVTLVFSEVRSAR